MNSISHQEFLAPCCAIAREAGRLLMRYYQDGFSTAQKEDKSPVTEADIAANRLITEALRALTPEIPVIAEEDETMNAGGHALFWLVDPLDGTRSFVKGEAEFSVNIGLIKNGAPLLGVIHAPPQDMNYWGAAGTGAFRAQGDGSAQSIKTRTPAGGLVVTRSKSHPSAATIDYLAHLSIKETRLCSSAVKFCQVAEGSADIYPRFGRTMEWDTAAGHAIVNAAGGRVETADGKPLLYGKPGFENPAFIAYGK